MLVPSQLARMHMLKSEAAEKYFHHHCGFPAEPDEDERLLASVYSRSLMKMEPDARRRSRKNSKALRLGIEQSEREAKEKATGRLGWRSASGGRTGSSDSSKGSSSHPPHRPTTTTMTSTCCPMIRTIFHQPPTGRGKGRRGSGESSSSL
ncbi:Phosphorylated carbohydrates phosphatase [Hordeum vulgare]|nr:Phosphorylated carbohydrates phosphatase [Hordeum vulgare]